MITTLFRGQPEQYLHTLARTHTTHHFKSKPSCAEVLALGVFLPHTACIFVFDVYKMLRFMFGSVKTFLAAPAFCMVFTMFSYYPTTLLLATPALYQLHLLHPGWDVAASMLPNCDSGRRCKGSGSPICDSCTSCRGSLYLTVPAGEVAEAQAPKLRQQPELQARRGRNCQTTGKHRHFHPNHALLPQVVGPTAWATHYLSFSQPVFPEQAAQSSLKVLCLQY